MTKFSRAGLSLASAVTADLVVGVFLSLFNPAGTRIDALIGFLYFSSFLVLPGWLLALPVVLMITQFERWRLWAFLAVGSVIGPALIICVATYSYLRDSTFSSFAPGAYQILYVATGVSTLTAILYVSLIRAIHRAQRS